MKIIFLHRRLYFSFTLFVPGLILLSSVLTFAQVGATRSTSPDLDNRRDGIKQVSDNNRIYEGMNADKEVNLKKEEKQAIVAEAFKRLQILHNEYLKILESKDAPDSALINKYASETKLRATQLHNYLSFPKEEKKPKKNEQQINEKQINDVPLKNSLMQICETIKSFVININNSPTDRSAGIQAQRDLENIFELSSKVVDMTSPKEKPNKPN